MQFKLFYDVTPKTCENFRALCTGELGKSPVSGKPIHFLNTLFHRVIRGFMAQGGDFTRGDGTGGESIYGSKFADEDFTRLHDSAGLLSMANAGANTNGSQFFILFGPARHLDGKHVVFGKLTKGMDVLRQIERVNTRANDKPTAGVRITSCGEVDVTGSTFDSTTSSRSRKKVAASVPVSMMGKEELEALMRTGFGKKRPKKPWQKEGYRRSKGQEVESAALAPKKTPADASKAPAAERTAADDVANDGREQQQQWVVDSAASGGLTGPGGRALTKREEALLELRQRMNVGRKQNTEEVKEEFLRFSDPSYKKKKRKEEWNKYKESRRKEMIERGDSTSTLYINESADRAKAKSMKQREKKRKQAAFGWDVFNTDTLYKAYERRLDNLPKKRFNSGVAITETAYELNYGDAPKPAEANLQAMTKDLEQMEDRRKNFSRRRTVNKDADVDYINERNRHFNKKIARAFDKYTVEIRQNLERGTAL